MDNSVFSIKNFFDRHCGFSDSDRNSILKELGFDSLEDFGKAVIPSNIYNKQAPNLGKTMTETEVLKYITPFAKKNIIANSMIGLGYYKTKTPPVILRKLLENPDWYTAYTPYQAEISQGRLELLLHFQTIITELTGLPLAGASLLDEATAAAEAMTLSYKASKKNSLHFLVDNSIFSQILALLKTRAKPLGIQLIITSYDSFLDYPHAFGAILSYPGGDGELRDHTQLVKKLKEKDIFCICNTDLLALNLIKPPSKIGFHIAVGSSQRFGMPMGFGGPHAGFIASEKEFQRQLPGRIVGISQDSKNRPAYRLALQTREQHIRREKATSNICTAQTLPAMVSTAYVIYHGPKNLRKIAEKVHWLASCLKEGLEELDFTVITKNFFDTIRILLDKEQQKKIISLTRKAEMNILSVGDKIVGISLDELTKEQDIDKLLELFASLKNIKAPLKKNKEKITNYKKYISFFLRDDNPLSQKIFHTYHTEHEMLRFLKKLADKDISLNRSMIPLGSCTMKLNSTTEMSTISLPEFAFIHPFAPKEQVMGYLDILEETSDLLKKITGFHSISLQPNAGAQGEFAGLLVIRDYLKSIGEENRNICLIPSSAHGTNPASAIMAGMEVVSVEIDKEGQVSFDDLKEKVKKYKKNIAALMITYPSTCGVFGANIQDICQLIHEAGGQVYMDGANLNALVGIVYPAKIGPDVMHINLHKTFCIPHGGGGPGMGPIGVKEHLAPFIPNHPFDYKKTGDNRTISAAPFGSGLIILISWAYIRMMGGEGLKKATLNALLAANYIAKKLDKKFPILYKGKNGFVAHECVLEIRNLKATSGITVEDIAKRLIDFGYHAPTISWPLAGTMMIEPTESETKAEIDRFCEALFKIAEEVKKIEKGEFSKTDNPIIHAPHTAEDLLNANWDHLYSREEAAYPLNWIRKNKYWPPVSRINAVLGDRNLICSFPVKN